MSGFNTNIVPINVLDTYANIMNYIKKSFLLNATTMQESAAMITITETTEVDPKIKESVQYIIEDEYERIIHSASNWLEIFRYINMYSFFMPYAHMQCKPIVDNDMIDNVAETLESQADNVAKKSRTNGNNNNEEMDVETDETLKILEYSEGINYNDCNFMLENSVMKKIKKYIGKGITVYDDNKPNSSGDKKNYTININNILLEEDKDFFKHFISIPPDVEEYVKANDVPGKRKDLPICYLGTNRVHSYLFIQMPYGKVFVIGFGAYASTVGYDKSPIDEDTRHTAELPGRAFGYDIYYTKASPDLNFTDNWLSYVCFLTTKILENLKQMLESTTMIKFTTENNILTGSVNLCFFKSTAKEPKADNNYSYSYKHNCLGFVQRMLGLEIPVTEGSREEKYIWPTKNENVPYYLKPLSPDSIKAIEKAHRTGGSNALYHVIKYIQKEETPYGIQSFFSEDEPDPLIKRFTMQNIRELFRVRPFKTITNETITNETIIRNYIYNEIMKDTNLIHLFLSEDPRNVLKKIFILNHDNGEIEFNKYVDKMSFNLAQLQYIFSSEVTVILNYFFYIDPEQIEQIFTPEQIEQIFTPEQIKKIFTRKQIKEIYEKVGAKRKIGGKRTKAKSRKNKSKSKRTKAKSRKNKAKKKTLRRRKN